MKTSPEPVNVLLVGGGSIVAPENLKGVARLIRPQFFSVANAVGAAMAKGEPQSSQLQRLLIPCMISRWRN